MKGAGMSIISTQLMLGIEKQHLDSTVRASTELLGALLCDEFKEFGSSGIVHDREDVLKSVTSSTEVVDYRLDEFEIIELGEGYILATYKLSEQRGDLFRLTLRSTVWKLVGKSWRMLFHQSTKHAK